MSGADDIIATLSVRVSELSKRVAQLQSDLESAQRRIALYEEHDATIQDALASALRAAYQIRERAETAAEQVLEQAREERRLLLKEIERLRDERDTLQNEIAERRRSSLAPLAPRPATTDAAAAEIRQLASEALRGLFRELVDDIRATSRPAAPPAPPPAPAPAAEPVRAAEPEPVRAAAPEPVRAAAPEPVRAAAPEPTDTPEPAATIEEDIEPAILRAERPARSAVEAAAPPRLEVVPSAPPFGSEIEEVAPARVAAAAPTSDLQVVLTPVGSFPRLVEIERHIQSLPPVRTLYVRDFRGGSATLAVSLRAPLTPEEFGAMLTSLDAIRLRVMGSTRNVIELRIDGEASIA